MLKKSITDCLDFDSSNRPVASVLSDTLSSLCSKIFAESMYEGPSAETVHGLGETEIGASGQQPHGHIEMEQLREFNEPVQLISYTRITEL